MEQARIPMKTSIKKRVFINIYSSKYLQRGIDTHVDKPSEKLSFQNET